MPEQQVAQQHAWKREDVVEDAAATRAKLENGEQNEAMRLRGGCVCSRLPAWNLPLAHTIHRYHAQTAQFAG